MHEGIVAVEELAGWVGDVYAFLYLLEEQAIFFFRGAAVRNVADNVNRAFLRIAFVGIGGRENHREAAKTWVGALGKLFGPAHGAVRASRPLAEAVRERGLASIADYICGCETEMLEQNLIGFD